MRALLAAPAVLVPVGFWLLANPFRWLMLFFAAALLLPPLPVQLGNSGPHVSMAIAAAGLFCGAITLRDWRIFRSQLNSALLTLFGVILASVAAAAIYSGMDAAAASLARVALLGIPIYVFFFAAYAPANGLSAFLDLSRLYWIGAAAALFACVDFYYQLPAPAGYGPQFVWLDSGVYRRAQGLFYEASTLGNFCAFFLVMIAVSFSRPRGAAPPSRKALAAGGALFFAALVLSYSRGSVVNVAVACAVLIWMNRKRVRLARIGGVLAICAGAGSFALWKIFPEYAANYWLRLSASSHFFTAPEQLSGRVESWRTLSAWIAAHPWETLFGIGYKTLPYTDYLGSPVVADNMYLSLLVETGVAGLAALVWLNIAILRTAAQAARSADARRGFFGMWLLCFWSGEAIQMLSGDLLTYWRVLPVYFWALAMCVRE
jgi:O-antigen ligase